MCAALAVRLALMKVLAEVDIAFFDEPTTNMDRARRQQLAEAIGNLRSFQQIFVISHDDTFESITENIIRVDRSEWCPGAIAASSLAQRSKGAHINAQFGRAANALSRVHTSSERQKRAILPFLEISLFLLTEDAYKLPCNDWFIQAKDSKQS